MKTVTIILQFKCISFKSIMRNNHTFSGFQDSYKLLSKNDNIM